MTNEQHETTCREAGRRGGITTSERYGREHYVKAGKKGGTTTSRRYGHGFYEEIGHKGGRHLAELARLGREAEQKSLDGRR